MKRLLLWSIPLALLAGVLILYSSNRQSVTVKTDVSYSIERVTLPRLVKESDGILIGKVAKVVNPYLLTRKGFPEENSPVPIQKGTIEVEKWLVNSKDFPNRFNISWFGGSAQSGNKIIESDKLVSLRKDERILLFVSKTTFYNEDTPRIVPDGYNQGIYILSGENGISYHPDGRVDRKTNISEVNKLIKELRTSRN